MAGLKADSTTLQALLTEHMPALAAMLERNCLFLEILTPPWFMCLFFTWLPAETTARLWDVAQGETIRHYTGHHKAVICVALHDRSAGGSEQ